MESNLRDDFVPLDDASFLQLRQRLLREMTPEQRAEHERKRVEIGNIIEAVRHKCRKPFGVTIN